MEAFLAQRRRHFPSLSSSHKLHPPNWPPTAPRRHLVAAPDRTRVVPRWLLAGPHSQDQHAVGHQRCRHQRSVAGCSRKSSATISGGSTTRTCNGNCWPRWPLPAVRKSTRPRRCCHRRRRCRRRAIRRTLCTRVMHSTTCVCGARSCHSPGPRCLYRCSCTTSGPMCTALTSSSRAPPRDAGDDARAALAWH